MNNNELDKDYSYNIIMNNGNHYDINAKESSIEQLANRFLNSVHGIEYFNIAQPESCSNIVRIAIRASDVSVIIGRSFNKI